jgi:Type IV secretion-system coupling protein DNA-binding domain
MLNIFVALVPSIPMGREREARHFLIVGSVGGGKTQTCCARNSHSACG